jgi:hypothetical protein
MLNTELSTQIKSVDLAELARREGLSLHRAGRNWQGCCPFHQEKNPSFTIFPNNSFYCFGCGQSGDAVNFVRKLHSLSFPDALKYLGIENKALSKKAAVRIKKDRERKLAAAWRERDVAFTLATMIRNIHKKMNADMDMVDLYNGFGLLDRLHEYETMHDLLINGDDDQKKEVMQELRAMPIERRTIFKKDFNYRGWLNKFLSGEPHETSSKKRYAKVSFG